MCSRGHSKGTSALFASDTKISYFMSDFQRRQKDNYTRFMDWHAGLAITMQLLRFERK